MKTVLLCLVIVFCNGCNRMVNRVSFFPDKSDPVVSADNLPPNTTLVSIETPDHEKLSCYFLSAPSTKLLIYYHGNAQNIDMRLPELAKYRDLGINVLGVGYRGYGRSTGNPSEAGVYCDGEAALQYATDSLGVPMEAIILCGRSIGTTVAVNTAQKKNIGGLILITPLSNGREFARSHHIGFLSWFLGNPFDNQTKCKNINAPILIIHGIEDEIIPYELGLKLYEAFQGKKKLVTIPGGKHNNLERVDPKAYWGAIEAFLEK